MRAETLGRRYRKPEKMQFSVLLEETHLTQKSYATLHLPVDATLQLTMLRAHAGLFDDQQTHPFL